MKLGLVILRGVFLMVACGLGVFFVRSDMVPEAAWAKWAAFSAIFLGALAVIILDMLVKRKDLANISAVYFGIIVGLFLAYIVGLAFNSLPIPDGLREGVHLILSVVLCYLCISLLMQTKDDFRFIIPYVEFAKEIKGRRPYILDTSVIIDGKIADLAEAHLFDTQLIMPRFVIGELQAVADSADRMRRSRGRRGLDVLNRLRNNPEVDLEIYDRELPEFAGQPVDMKLVVLAKHLQGTLVTNDYNLNKVARVHGVKVINLNDVANAMKPIFLPGEQVEVRLVKPGEEPGQGIGYLDDGTMVVVEGGRDHLQEQALITVTSVLQTSAGRMVFGRYDSTRAK
jgi:uncharacterized protein YacL